MTSDKLVPVFSALNEIQAVLYRSMLEEAGIDVFEEMMEDDVFVGVKLRGMHSRLMVREEDAQRATDLVIAYSQEVDRGELIANDDAGESTADTPPQV